MTLGCFIDSQFRHFLSGGWFWIGGTLIAASANAQMSVGAPIDQRMANQIVSGTTAALGSLNNQFGLASSPSGLPLPSPKEANIQRPLLGTATPSQPWQPLSRFTLDAITKHIEANSGSHVVLTYSDGTTEAVSSTPAGFSALQPSSTTSRSKLERSVRNPRGLTLRYGIQGEPSEIQADDLSGADSTDLPHRTRAERFLRTNGDLLQLRNPGNETKLSSESIDAGGTRRFRYKQMFQGVPVFGHDGSIYVNAYGAVKSFRGHFRPTPLSIDVRPKVSIDTAKQEVKQNLGANALTVHTYELTILPAGEGRPDKLAWRLDVSTSQADNWHYFVDAHSGTILKKIDAIEHGVAQASGVDLKSMPQSFVAWQSGANYYLIDVTKPVDHSATANPVSSPSESGDINVYNCAGQSFASSICYIAQSSAPTTGWNTAAVSAISNLYAVTSYYLNTHGRIGIDGLGGKIRAVVNDSSKKANASWNPATQTMLYGMGDNQTFSNLAAAVDVTGHEMTHGVVSSTAALVSSGQSAEINESLADFFGVMVARKSWTVGSDVVLISPGFLRSMANPHQGLPECSGVTAFAQPQHMSEYVQTSDPHCNMGIPNRAAYLIAQGLTVEGKGTSIGLPETEKIYYYALVNLMHSSDQFIDLRRNLIAAADYLYGSGSKEESAVKAAFDSVGIVEAPQVPSTTASSSYTDADPVNGVSYLIYIDQNGWIYLEGSSGKIGPINAEAATITRPAFGYNSTTSIGYLFYAGQATGSLHSIQLSTGNDTVLTPGNASAMFYAVAVDPTLKRAAMLFRGDSHIWTYDFATAAQNMYPIVITTQDGGVVDVGALPSDLSFDYLGENLLFDFSIPQRSASGSSYNTWSIGNLNLLTGQISTIANKQPPNINFANAIFATNNRYIWAVDAWDSSTMASSVIMCNTNTLSCASAVQPDLNGLNRGTLGQPAFNRDDSRMFYRTRSDPYSYNFIYSAPIAKANGVWRISGGGTQSSSYGAQYPLVITLGKRNVISTASLSTAAISYGTVAVGSSQTSYVTLTNTGNVDLTITSTSFSDPAFSTTGVPGLVSRGQSISIPVTFAPVSGSGSKTGTLTLYTDANNPTFSISLTGIAGAASSGVTSQLVQGWNLMGNSVEAPITVGSTFGDATKVISVWKWIPGGSKWAFYTPTQSDGGASYAASKGYSTLTTINAGEGFWVNAAAAFSVPLPSGTAVLSSSFKPTTTSPAAAGGPHALPSGWSLISTGDKLTPAQFDAAIATSLSTPPAAGQVYTNLTTLWAWDSAKQKWYFWAPALVNSGGLGSFLSSKNYLDFSTALTTPSGTLSPATGIWVNMP